MAAESILNRKLIFRWKFLTSADTPRQDFFLQLFHQGIIFGLSALLFHDRLLSAGFSCMTAASDIFPIYQTLNPYHIRTKYENYLAFHVLKYTTCTSFLTSCFLK